MVYFLFSLSFSFSSKAEFEAYFIDWIAEHSRQAIKLGELAQKESKSIELKRMARKIMRDKNRDLKKLQSWREGYFDEASREYWFSPESEILADSPEENFDLKYLNLMIEHHSKGVAFLNQSKTKTKISYLQEFIKDSLKEHQSEIKQMHDLQRTLIYGFE